MSGTGLSQRRAGGILVIGAGHMGGALVKGCVAAKIRPLFVVEPHPSPPIRALARARKIRLHKTVDEIGNRRIRACAIALKPQVLKTEAPNLKPVARSGALMLSIAAGTRIATLAKAWGRGARIVRAMPNTPGAVGKGISAIFAPRNIGPADRRLAVMLLSALGQTIWVREESLLDPVTAVSGSGPAYVFLMVEALAAAAEQQGLPRADAMSLARATVIGSGALLDADPRDAAELRKAVTSPHGTTEAALDILMSPRGLPELIARAVSAATKRAKELGA